MLAADEAVETDAARAPPALAPWRLDALRLAPADAEALLATADGQRVLAQGMLVGDDLAFWARAFRFAATLVAREAFLPSLMAAPGGWCARWEPVLAGDDAD